MKTFPSVLSLILLGVLCLNGCGYSTRSALPARLRTIYVEEFKNKVDFTDENQRGLYIPLLETDIRKAIIDRYVFDGALRLSNKEEADLVLRGDLVDYVRQTLRFTDDDDPLEYRVQIIVNLEMWDSVKQKIYWREDGFTGEAEYFVTGAKATTEESAVEEAIADLARRIVERTVEDW